MFTLLKIVAKIVLLDMNVLVITWATHVLKVSIVKMEILTVIYAVSIKYAQQQQRLEIVQLVHIPSMDVRPVRPALLVIDALAMMRLSHVIQALILLWDNRVVKIVHLIQSVMAKPCQ